MKPFNRPPVIGEVPTLGDGEPPDPDIQEQVVSNQVKSAAQWNDTAQDIVMNNIINEREDRRETRWHIVAMCMVALIVLLWGSWYTYANYTHDRVLAAQEQASQEKPYTPETIR